MRWMNWWSAAAVVSALLGYTPTSQAQALTADSLAVSDAALDRMRSSAYAALMRQEYALQPDGNLRGKARVVDASGTLTPARVKLFFVRHGEIVSQASPDSEGNFQATGLSPGYYSVISNGPGGFSSTGMKVVPPPEKSEAPKANTIGRTRTVAMTKAAQQAGADTVYLSVIQPVDIVAAWGVARMMNGGIAQTAPNTGTPAQLVSTASEKSETAADAEIQYSDEVILSAYERNAYFLGADGKLTGRLTAFNAAFELVPAPNMPVYFLRDGRVVAQTRSDARSEYQVALTPGYYAMVIAGDGKFGATGINVLPPPAVEQVPAPGVKSISFAREAVQPPPPPPPPPGSQGDANTATGGGPGGGGGLGGGGGTGGGGAPGGGGGGAGGGGAFGGLGGLAGAAAVVGGAAAVSENNNNGGTTNNSGTNNNNSTNN